MQFTTEDFEVILNDQAMESIGLLLGALLTGALLTLGISTLFLLPSRAEDGRLLRSNCLLRTYVIISSLSVLAFDAGILVVANETAILKFFSQSLKVIDKSRGMLFSVVGSTTMIVILLADGVLVHLLSYLNFWF